MPANAGLSGECPAALRGLATAAAADAAGLAAAPASRSRAIALRVLRWASGRRRR